jgi:hypothetical protein
MPFEKGKFNNLTLKGRSFENDEGSFLPMTKTLHETEFKK